jgi:hypothetical protein
MRRLSGQAARILTIVLHRLATLAMALAAMAGVGIAALAWRLSQGPVDLPWLAARIEAAANAGEGPTRLAIGSAALAWEGFRLGVDRPLDLRLTDITVTDQGGAHLVSVPRAEVSVSFGALLLGRVLLRAVELDQPTLTLLRGTDGNLSLDIGSLSEAADSASPAEPAPAPGQAPEAEPTQLPRPALGSSQGPSPAQAPSAPPGAAPGQFPGQASGLTTGMTASQVPGASPPSAAPSPDRSKAPTPGPPPGPAPLAALLAELARPASTDRAGLPGLFSQLRRVRIHDARITIVDRQLGAIWHAPQAEIDLARRRAGGIDGTADLALALGDQRARLTASATLAAGATETRLRAWLTPVTPAALARAAPGLAPLAALDALVAIQTEVTLDAALAPRQVRLTAQVGAGAVRLGANSVPLSGALLVASGSADRFAVQTLKVSVLGHEGGIPSTVQAAGTVHRAAGRVEAAVTLDLDQLALADLPVLWPPITQGGARPWIVENITGGMARNAHFAFGVTAPDDLSDVTLTQASGTADASDVTVHWLRPVPPVVQGAAQLRIIDPDSLEIVFLAGRERLPPRDAGGLALRGGRMQVTGLMEHDQTGKIIADVAGPVADAVALLRQPRLHLFDKHPLDLQDPSGQATATVVVTMPLENKVRMDDIAIQVAAKLDGLHLGAVVAGRDLDQGTVTIKADVDGLTASGSARLASIPAQLDMAMDFRTGQGSEVLQRVTVTGRPDAAQLAAAGLDAGGTLSGPVPLKAVLTEQRSGAGEVQVEADLAGAELVVAPLGWRKPAGRPARASARVVLSREHLVGIDRITVDGDGIAVQGTADFASGRLAGVRLDRLALGRTSASGTLHLPASLGAGPITADIRGSVLDLSGRFATEKATAKPPQTAASGRGPPWSITARFDQALMANGAVFRDVSAQVDNDGLIFARMHVTGSATGSGAPTGGRVSAPVARAAFALDIAPDRNARRLTASAADTGTLLRGLDLVQTMQGGRLTASGTYDDSRADHPLAGTAEIDEFRIHNAPALGKLLQAMTLYGVVDVMRGPGLGFTKMVVPFRLTEEMLALRDAVAFSASLGLTAKGTINRGTDQLDFTGTIVPAYFFNSLLGNIPVVGRLFSPEHGGGVFAASYAVQGPMADPKVSVNPLAALTPGFLRGMFKIF